MYKYEKAETDTKKHVISDFQAGSIHGFEKETTHGDVSRGVKTTQDNLT